MQLYHTQNNLIDGLELISTLGMLSGMTREEKVRSLQSCAICLFCGFLTPKQTRSSAVLKLVNSTREVLMHTERVVALHKPRQNLDDNIVRFACQSGTTLAVLNVFCMQFWKSRSLASTWMRGCSAQNMARALPASTALTSISRAVKQSIWTAHHNRVFPVVSSI